MPNVAKHPRQPFVWDDQKVVRFKANAIVQFLLDNGPFDMNQLAVAGFSEEDQRQFAQLIGYSACGYCELSYVSDDEKDIVDDAVDRFVQSPDTYEVQKCRGHWHVTYNGENIVTDSGEALTYEIALSECAKLNATANDPTTH